MDWNFGFYYKLQCDWFKSTRERAFYLTCSSHVEGLSNQCCTPEYREVVKFFEYWPVQDSVDRNLTHSRFLYLGPEVNLMKEILRVCV